MAKYSTATVAGFTDYHAARGRELPGTWDEDLINAALLVASEWIDNVYGASFIGQKVGGFTQDREWPRIAAVIEDPRYGYAFPSDAIPDKLIEAVYEAAFRQAVNPGSLLVDYTPAKYKSVSIDGAVSVEYAQFSSAYQTQTSYPIIDQLLYWLLCNSSSAAVSSYSGSIIRV
jgi:hypothetical protein